MNKTSDAVNERRRALWQKGYSTVEMAEIEGMSTGGMGTWIVKNIDYEERKAGYKRRNELRTMKIKNHINEINQSGVKHRKWGLGVRTYKPTERELAVGSLLVRMCRYAMDTTHCSASEAIAKSMRNWHDHGIERLEELI